MGTPASGKRMPVGPAPDGYGKSINDKESPNTAEAFDGSKEVFPLEEKDHLEQADGVS